MSQYLDYDDEVEWSYLSAVGLIRPKPGKLQQVTNFAKILLLRMMTAFYQLLD